MRVRSFKRGLAGSLIHLVVLAAVVRGGDTTPSAKPDELPPTPKGIEVLARGPVHEAFASPTGDPLPTKAVANKPPKPLDEMPPAEKPEGNVVWIGGYWAWDDERKDFLWVSGVWRTPPRDKQWIAGYWREEGEQWQWVPGFWARATAEQETKEVSYLPQPPATPEVAPPGRPPVADSFYVPGVWMWNPQAGNYAWRAGYWARVQPGYVWVADHYRWTPAGYIYVPGYWDLAVSRRGVLYAPVVVDPAVVTASFYYTPAYAVSDTVVVDALFVRPAYAHYYFGDYYGPTYATMGYESVVVYSGRRYDSIIVYETWVHRSQPNWISLQINIFNGRSRGVLPVPPRTLVQQNTIVQQNITKVTNVTNVTNVTKNYNTTVLAPTTKIVAAKGLKTVPLNTATREQAKQQAAAVQQVAAQRTATEKPLPPGAPRQARVASLSVPKAQPVQPGFVAPKVSPQAARNVQAPKPPQPAPATHPTTTGVQPPARPTPNGAHPGFAPPGSHPPAQRAQSGKPPPGASRQSGRQPTPPSRRPPPKDKKEQR
ncbi:MAG TPA: YXWGXW repeat-containing protein [Gemmataceae bacterium]|jgi:hypothetical protein